MLGSRSGMGAADSADMDDRGPPPARSSGGKPSGGGQKPAGKFDDLEDDIPF